jgi:hypothetical protein
MHHPQSDSSRGDRSLARFPRTTLRTVSAVALLVAAGMGLRLATAQDTEKKEAPPAEKKERFFEQRIYITHPGRLTALHHRFREHTNRLFEKHGMDLVGYWTPTDGPEAENTLIYILAYPSREAREQSWKDFLNDPEWKKVYEESHRDGPIVMKVESKFLIPTDYSPIK